MPMSDRCIQQLAAAVHNPQFTLLHPNGPAAAVSLKLRAQSRHTRAKTSSRNDSPHLLRLNFD